MRIFVVLSDPPTPSGEAVETVSYEVIRQMRQLRHTPIIQILLRYPRNSAAGLRSEQLIAILRTEGYEALPILYLSDVAGLNGKTTQTLVGKAVNLLKSFQIEEMFPASRLGSAVEARALELKADALLSIWSWEALAATYRIWQIPKIAYYGNPDHLPAEARLKNPEIFGLPTSGLRNRVSLRLSRLQNHRRKTLHIRMMNQCEAAVNNSYLDFQFYAKNGHRNSLYLQNMWPTCMNSSAETPALNGNGPVKLIGSVGTLGSTGNTFALHYLGAELMPHLAKRFSGRPFEIHVFGKGSPSGPVEQALTDPRIIRRGWVDNLNDEIRSAAVFLVLTNVNKDFLVGNTRILLAWSLRSCVVMHANSVLAMPEIEHGKNALLGETPDEIADLILQAVTNEELRRGIGQGGYETFQRYYRSDVVVPKMLSLIEETVRGKTGPPTLTR